MAQSFDLNAPMPGGASDDDELGLGDVHEALFQASQNLDRGHYKAALRYMADAANILAVKADINGGGWY